MKGSVLKSFALVVVACRTLSRPRYGPRPAGDEGVGNVPASSTKSSRPDSRAGSAFLYVDPIKETCEDAIPPHGQQSLASAYFSADAKLGRCRLSLPIAAQWQMEQDEAIVIIGQTPPAVSTLVSRPGLNWACHRPFAAHSARAPSSAVPLAIQPTT